MRDWNQTTGNNVKQGWGAIQNQSALWKDLVNCRLDVSWGYYYHTMTQDWWSTAHTKPTQREALLTQGNPGEIITSWVGQ